MKEPIHSNAIRRVAWITGASSGIGRAVALKLADEGCLVAVSARSADKLLALKELHPGRIHSFPMDITEQNAVTAGVSRIEDTLGPIFLTVFSAGGYKRDSAARFKGQALAEVITLNVIGTGFCLGAVIPRMLERHQGHIAVVSSVAGYVGLPGGAFYGATKAALINLCESLYPELEREGIKLTVINPGFVDTPLTRKNDFPMPFIISVDEAADAIIKGLKSNRFEVIFPWKMALSIKLLRALPRPLMFAITRKMLRKPGGQSRSRD